MLAFDWSAFGLPDNIHPLFIGAILSRRQVASAPALA
jgi:hypothetical protein